MRYVIAVLLSIATLTGCRHADTDTTISGNIEGMKNGTVYIYGIDEAYEAIDTIAVTDGKFSHKLSIDTTAILSLQLNDTLRYPIFVDKGEKLTVECKLNSKPITVSVAGSRPNEEMTLFSEAINNKDSLAKMSVTERAEHFINTNNTSLVCVYLLKQYFVDVPEPDTRKVDRLIKKLSGTLQDNHIVMSITDNINRLDNAAVNKFVPPFNLTDMNGETVSRSDNFKDMYLVISFWASWDNKSRKNNKELRKLYNKNKSSKKFGMLGVALDTDVRTLENAVEQDSLTWHQVFEDGALSSNLANQFGITSLPTNILVSPEGRILRKDCFTDSISAIVERGLSKK